MESPPKKFNFFAQNRGAFGGGLTDFGARLHPLFTKLSVFYSRREPEAGAGVQFMLHHRALGRGLEDLTVAVIDNRRPMLAMMRAMLAAIGVGRIETYDGPAEALKAMTASQPDLVIAAVAMEPLTGPELIRTMRHHDAGPLRFIPAMIMSAPTKPCLLDEALRAGAHQVLVLPIAASTLYRRLDWLINDDRPYELRNGHYVVAGLEQRLAANFPKAEPATPVPVPLPVAPVAKLRAAGG